MLKHTNTNLQGNVGIARAVLWYTEQGYIVSVPLTDSQPYDLIVDSGKELIKVQVKTATTKARGSNSYAVYLRTMSNVKGAKMTTKYISEEVDFVFVVTEEDNYLIPSGVLAGMSMATMSKKYSAYKI